MTDVARFSRKRKTKAPCPGCFLHADLCLCAEIPCLNLKTRVSLIVHAKELKRTTNTGRLAVKALANSEIRVRGEGREALSLADMLATEYQPVLFYPSEDAVELNAGFVMAYSRPLHLIVPDGNWRQASKVHSRHRELAGIPRVKIAQPNAATHFLRTESTPEGMATLQAIAHALRVIEGEEVFQKLNGLYRLKLERTLKGRGLSVEGVDVG